MKKRFSSFIINTCKEQIDMGRECVLRWFCRVLGCQKIIYVNSELNYKVVLFFQLITVIPLSNIRPY